MTLSVGTYTNTELTFEAYMQDRSAISSSWLSTIIDSTPAHLRYKLDNDEVKETDAQRHGSLIHTAILEPDLLEKRYAVVPPPDARRHRKANGEISASPGNTSAYKQERDAFMSQNAGKIFVSEHEYDMAEKIRDSAWSCSTIREILSHGRAENTLVWHDKETGLLCKARRDWVMPSHIPIDLKSSRSAESRSFAKSIINYHYDIQAAHYTDSMSDPMYCWIVVEKEPPYAVAIYNADIDIIERGQYFRSRAMKKYLECLNSGKWPGYEDRAAPIQLPNWAQIKFHEEQ